MSNETLNAVASSPAEPVAAPAPAPAAPESSAATAAPPVDPAQPSASTPVDEQPADQPADAAQPPTAPEAYEITPPEGVQFEAETLDELKALAKENNLPAEATQKLAELGAKAVQKFQERMTEQYIQTQQQWVNDSRADKEFGGDKLTENLAVAKRALDAFGTPELVKLFNESGLGNHPEVIRYNFRVAQAISEDRIVPGSTKPSGPSGAQNFYGKSQMNP